MLPLLDLYREMTFTGVLARLLLAMLCGGLIGINRERLRRPKGLAGFRTYMLVCIGAALAMLLGQYEYVMVTTSWAETAGKLDVLTDVSRFGAQVINGIGFLGAGTIIVTRDEKIKGLTTAAGLWASGCLGLAIGAGFFECAIISVVLIVLCMYGFSNSKAFIQRHSRVAYLCVEVAAMSSVGDVIHMLRDQDAGIIEMDLGRPSPLKEEQTLSVEIVIELPPHMRIESILASIARIDTVKHVHER